MVRFCLVLSEIDLLTTVYKTTSSTSTGGENVWAGRNKAWNQRAGTGGVVYGRCMMSSGRSPRLNTFIIYKEVPRGPEWNRCVDPASGEPYLAILP